MTYVPGMEKMLYGTFVKRFVTFKRTQIPKRLVTLDETAQLPNGSVFHMLDNLDTFGDPSDFPKVTSNILLINEKFKKYIQHNALLITDRKHPLFKKHAGVFKTAGLEKVLMEFNKRNRSFIYPTRNIDSIVKKDTALTVINHNPLWRLKIVGKLAEYRKFELMLRAIIAKINSIPGEKYQYIEIPLTQKLYTQGDYKRAVTKGVSAATVKYNDDWSYFMLLHLFSFIFPGSELSLFHKIPEEMHPFINLIFRIKNNVIVYTLADIKAMVKDKNTWVVFMRHINLLKMSAVEPDIKKIADLDEKAFDAKVAEVATTQTEATTTDMTGDVNETGISETPVTTIEPAPPTTQKPVEFVKEIDDAKNDYIETLEGTTPAQKERLRKISDKYKEISVGGTPIAQLIGNDPDLELNTNSLDFLKGEIPDESMLKSSISDMDSLYMERLYQRDLAQVLISFAKNGLYLIDYSTENQVDELNRIVHHTAVYQDAEGKRHTIKFKLPIIDADGNFIVNGIKNRMKKQQINVPICKISNTRVSLAASYKTLVERNTNKAHSFKEWITTYIKKINEESKVVDVKFGSNTYTQKLPYEYTTLGSRYDEINFGKIKMFFKFDERKVRFTSNAAQNLESEHGVLFGTIKGQPNSRLYIGLDNRVRIVNIVTKEVEETTSIIELLMDVTEKTPKMVSEWTDLKILDQKLPIIFILGYKFGLLNTLKYLGVDYKVYDKGIKFEAGPTDMVVKFADKTLVYNRYPMEHSLIVNGLFMYKTNKIPMEAFDTPDVYYELLLAKNISTNYIKGIDTFFNLFLDPITRDVLANMGEPTNIRDLLIRASSMLATEEHIKPASMANHRLRSYERLNTVLYDEMARQLAKQQHRYGSKQTYSINPEAVFQRVIQDQSVIAVNDINPIHDIKEQTGFTYSGAGGRTATSFVLNDRQYPEDGVGILSEATPDSGKVAINAFTSMNPRITNLRGVYGVGDNRPVDPTELLSVTGILMPGSTNDDPKRANFINIQLSHHVPCENGEPGRVRTGYERVIAHRTTSEYAYAAKENGKIIDVNDKLKLVTIQYKGGEKDVIKFGISQGNVSGIYLNQELVLNCKAGETVKKGDVLVYNPGFFTPEHGSKQVSWKQGVHANVMLMESDDTFEDSSQITKPLGKKLSMKPTELRTIKINNKTVLHDIVKVGQEIKNTDTLCTIEDEDIDSLSITQGISDEAFEMVAQLSRKQPKAKFSGYISEIDVFYSSELKDIHPSVQALIKKVNSHKNQKATYAKGSSSEDLYPKPGQVPTGTKMKMVEFDEDTVVIQFYITEDIAAGVGDKVVFDSSLKSVVASVIDEPLLTESGNEVDAIFSITSINNRVVLSPLRVGMINRVLEKAEQDVLDIFFD